MSVAKEVFADERAAAAACAERMERILSMRLGETERVAIAVSGGTTPKAMFETLRASRIDWGRVHWFWVDERCVAADDPGSNYGMTREAILDPAKIPEANIHRIQGERGPQLAAERYAEELRAFFGLGEGQFPEFDIVHLGMGEEGHTGSLFPGEPMIADLKNLTAAVSAPKAPHERATLLPRVIQAARHVLPLAAGAEKAWAAGKVFGTEYDPLHWPAQMVMRETRDVCWFLDRAAAQFIL